MKIKTIYRCEICGREFNITEFKKHKKECTGIFEFDPSTGTITGLTEEAKKRMKLGEIAGIWIPAQLDDVNVKNIDSFAFWNCEDLKVVALPSSVEYIGDFAFNGCSSLESITIPEGITSIGENAFGECNSLESITIPASVTRIGDSAFANCQSLGKATIPASVKHIGKNILSNCGNLKTIRLYSNVRGLAKYFSKHYSNADIEVAEIE